MRLKTIKYLLLLVSIFTSLTASADVEVNATNFPDEVFRNWVLQNVPGARDGVLTDAEIARITTISCPGKSISSLQGIEYFTALRELSCYSNQLTSLDVSKNTALRELSCYSNQLTSLDVSGCTSLTRLQCHENQLTSLDVSQNTELTSLSCYSNQLTSLDVSNSYWLSVLSCSDNQLTSLDVSQNTSLTSLSCISNQLTSLDVRGCTALTRLECGDNQLTSLDVSQNTALTSLYCESNKLTTLDVSKNTALTRLECWNNQLTSLDVSKNVALEYPGCSGQYTKLRAIDFNSSLAIGMPLGFDFSKVSNIKVGGTSTSVNVTTIGNHQYLVIDKTLPYSKGLSYTYDIGNNASMGVRIAINYGYPIKVDNYSFPDDGFRNWIFENVTGASDGELTETEIESVKEIIIYGNQEMGTGVSSLKGIEYFTALTRLECYYNQLTSLDVSQNTDLTSLSCNSNQLTSLDVRGCTALTRLECGDNQLTSLDVSGCTALTYLSCNSNQLTSLDVSQNTALTSLSCSENHLTSLGVSGCTALKELSCSSNQLTSLDVSKNTSLTSLSCSSNQLTSLDVSKNTALTSLSCSSNQLTSLDVNKNTALSYLSCSSNKLTSLDVSKNTALTSLSCGGNQLTTLDVSQNTALTYLSCYYNKLTSLDVSKNTALTQLQCYSNQLTSLDLSKNTSISYCSLYSQTISQKVVSIAAGVAIPVSPEFDFSSVSDLKLADEIITGNITTLNGQKYLVFAPLGTQESSYVWKYLSYKYDSGNRKAGMMEVRVLLTTTSTSDIVINATNFPDEKFRNWIVDNISWASDYLLTPTEIAKISSINCSNNGISSLQGIEFFVCLTSLSCYSNQLTSLDVSQNTALTSLSCYSNQLTSLDVSKNTALTSLDCDRNQLTSLDVSKNTALTSLSCYSNQLTSLDLSKNTSISSCSLSSQTLSQKVVSIAAGVAIPVSSEFDFSSVSDLKLADEIVTGNITTLNGQKYLVFAPVGTQESSVNWKLLSYKYDSGNSKAGMMGVRVLLTTTSTSDIEINATNFPDEKFRNWIVDNISGANDYLLTAAEIAKISSMDCRNNGITSLQGIEFFVGLTSLYCCSNQLTSLDVSQNTALMSLSCYSNQLTSLDVSKNTALTSLYCYSNLLTSLDVSKNTALTSLYCYSNQLTSLDVSKNTALTSLYCYSNQLTSLDVSKNTTLTSLSCNKNQLTSLDVSKNTALTSLYCSENQLTSLDVSKNTALTSLYCYSNQLTSLDVSKNTTLTSLSCNKNQLTSLDVSKNTALTSLYCSSNQLTCLDLSKNTSISSCSLSSQSFSQKIVNLSTGVAIPVPAEFDLTKVSDLKLAGEIVTGNIMTVNGQKYLVFAPVGTQESSVNWKLLSYKYDSGNSKAGMMEVRVLLTTTSTSDIEVNATNFPDEKFRNWIVANVAGAEDLLLTATEIAKISSMDCRNNGITSLQGIEFFVGLTSLYCPSNQLTSLDVSQNIALTSLSCDRNQLTSLNVSKNTALTRLSCGYNQLTSLDLSKNTSISSCSLSSQSLSQKIVNTSAGIGISVASDFVLSRVLNMKLADSAVDGKVVTMDGQKYLVLAQTGTDERTLKGLKLTYSYAADDSNNWSMNVAIVLSYGDPLKVDATNFPDDVFRNWIIEKISGAKDSILTDKEISEVTYMNCSGKGISSLQGIEFFTPLTSLYCYSNQLTSLDVSKNRLLKYLQCQNNQLMNLDLVNNTALVSSSSTQITPQSLSLMAVNTSAGIAIPVPSGFDITKLSNLKLADATITGSMTTIDGQAYLVFAEKATDENAINGKELTYSYNTGNELEKVAAMNVTVMLSYAATTYTLSIQSSIGGSVSYNGATVVNTTRSFVVREYATATITISLDKRYRLASLLVNDVDVTSSVSNNQFTISDITKNTSVVATFAEILENFSQEGFNYNMTSIANKTLNVGKGNYSGHVVIPATVSYDGDTWTVAGVVDGAFNLSAITAITWNPNTAIGDGAFGAQTNPNLLLYVKSEAYAPTNVQNVIANGRAKKIVLTDAASGNDFNCPEAFTAEEISYSHRYGMTTGIGECRGWETIALPFDVKQFTHESKGTLIPFKVYSSTTAGKPFWLYRLTASGWQEAANIEANTPYIISLPNNRAYDNDYNLPGVMTFSSSNVTVPVTEAVRSTYGDRTFVANFTSQSASWSIYALNVNNDLSSYSDYLPEGSTFIRELRTVHPFEAYMMNSSGNAKQFLPLFETLPTAIREIPMQDMRGMKGVRIYSMSGELIMFDQNISIEEALKQLKRGVYFVNGKKMVVK